MSQALTDVSAPISTELQEKVLLGGDLSKLSASERLSYYSSVCNSLGLNPLTRPFEYLTLNGKLTLYARKDCTEQLRDKKTVSITKLEREFWEGIYVVTAHAMDKDGRTDIAIGAVPIANLQGELRSNAMMKAETKAKRRVTLSICGLGMLDESEVDSIPDAKVAVTVMDAKREASQKIAELKQEFDHGQRETGQGALADALPSASTDSLDASAALSAVAFVWRIGKYKGESIVTIPDDYLDWFAQNGTNQDHREAAANELDRRRGQGSMA